MAKTKVAIIGSGNIGTDLMIKIMRLSDVLEMGAFVGIDPESDGLKRAVRLGVPITAGGIDGLIAMPEFADIEIVFDASGSSQATQRVGAGCGQADDRPHARRYRSFHHSVGERRCQS
jgi:acetaldehyde dehydrogenase (acetylating)